MPDITPDYGTLLKSITSRADAWAELTALPNLPNKTQMLAALQIFENDFTSMRQALRPKIATALGLPTTTTLTARLLRLMLAMYCVWKFRKILAE